MEMGPHKLAREINQNKNHRIQYDFIVYSRKLHVIIKP
jgi:hypothetical protein